MDKTCSVCGGQRTLLNTAHASTYVCRNCDLFPYIIMPLPDERVVEIQAEAGRKVREFKENG